MTCDPNRGSVHLVRSSYVPLWLVVHISYLFLYCYKFLWKYLLACHSSVARHHFMTGHRHKQTVLDRKPACCKTSLTWFLAVKMGSLQVFDCRVSNISAGQLEHTRTSRKEKQTSKEVCRTGWLHFTDPWIVSYGIYAYVR